MLKGVIEAERAERDQEADCARINAAIGLAEQDIAALESRQLEPDEMREKWSAIRDRTILAIRPVRHNVIERQTKAKQTERWMIEKSIREESDERVTREFSAELKKVETKPERTVKHTTSPSAKCWRNLHWPNMEISKNDLLEFVAWLRRQTHRKERTLQGMEAMV